MALGCFLDGDGCGGSSLGGDGCEGCPLDVDGCGSCSVDGDGCGGWSLGCCTSVSTTGEVGIVSDLAFL